MNTNLIRLEELIKETTNVINNLKADTKDLESEYNRKRQHKLDEIRACFNEMRQIIESLDCDVLVPTQIKSRYGDYYMIQIRTGHSPLIMSGANCCLDRMSDRHDYSQIKRNQTMKSGLSFDIDAILDGWNQEAFEIAFAEEVQKILVRKARLANQNYEDMKAKMETKEVI